MDELLHQLISRIHQHEIGTQEYTIALEHLLALVPHLPGIRQDKHPEYSKAVDKTLGKIPRHIDKWLDLAKIDVENTRATDLRRRFVNWVNRFLKNDICSLYRASRAGKPPLSLDNPIGGEQGLTTHKDRVWSQVVDSQQTRNRVSQINKDAKSSHFHRNPVSDPPCEVSPYQLTHDHTHKDMLADHLMPMDCLELSEWQKQAICGWVSCGNPTGCGQNPLVGPNPKGSGYTYKARLRGLYMYWAINYF